MKRLNIVHLYPKELNLYGDGGNLLCLKRRLEARRLPLEITEIGCGERLFDFDLLFIGGGQDSEMKIVARDIRKKSEALRFAIQSGKAVFAVCGGYQLLGETYKTAAGETLYLSGALPFYTVGGKERQIGNLVFETPYGTAVGFENHSGKTCLCGLPPLGRVICGYGNNGEDGTEGLHFQNTVGTYAHGPLLPKNPALADALLSAALGEELEPLDDTLENHCRISLIRRFAPRHK